MYSLKDQLLHSLATGLEYRHAFVEEKIRTGLAVQIKAIREQRKMNQTAFAQLLQKSQSWVSRLEDPNQAIPTIPTLLILAKAFDVDLDVRFVPFSEMLNRLSRLTPRAHEVPSFANDSFADKQLPIISRAQNTPASTESGVKTAKIFKFELASNTRHIFETQGKPNQLCENSECMEVANSLAFGGSR